jgi:hypothetical protein
MGFIAAPPGRKDTGGGLFWVTLHLFRAPGFPNGSSLRGYHMLAPLDEEGRLDPLRWRRQRGGCPVLRFWTGEPLLVGRLRHRAGGPGGTSWIIDYDPGATDERAGHRLDRYALTPGEQVTLQGADGALTFRVTQVSSRIPPGVRRQLLSASRVLPGLPDQQPAVHRERPALCAGVAASRWYG